MMPPPDPIEVRWTPRGAGEYVAHVNGHALVVFRAVEGGAWHAAIDGQVLVRAGKRVEWPTRGDAADHVVLAVLP